MTTCIDLNTSHELYTLIGPNSKSRIYNSHASPVCAAPWSRQKFVMQDHVIPRPQRDLFTQTGWPV